MALGSIYFVHLVYAKERIFSFFFLKCSVLTLIWLHGAYSEWRCAEHIQAFPTEGSGKTTPLNFRFVPS